ncbi:AtzH-like domain-containing protein [Xanthomonas oryzae]|uniref:AtzH-like domain-containing protein n=1 Tax=Xanthomonas oryzae TaxID=347 RepID=UPI001F4CBB0F|nr:AtzH-like domain-containing protein [Xanthomonas oryzae]UNE62891.1 nuclear transport factor 2 family protein [Xanthomonas oryzae]
MSIAASGIALPVVIAQVTAAFHASETALMPDDIAAMDALFHAAPSTVRDGVGEVLYGIDAVRACRIGRGGSPQRHLVHVQVHGFGHEFATTHAECIRDGSAARGRQRQTWARCADGWNVVAAQVSLQGTHA